MTKAMDRQLIVLQRLSQIDPNDEQRLDKYSERMGKSAEKMKAMMIPPLDDHIINSKKVIKALKALIKAIKKLIKGLKKSCPA